MNIVGVTATVTLKSFWAFDVLIPTRFGDDECPFLSLILFGDRSWTGSSPWITVSSLLRLKTWFLLLLRLDCLICSDDNGVDFSRISSTCYSLLNCFYGLSSSFSGSLIKIGALSISFLSVSEVSLDRINLFFITCFYLSRRNLTSGLKRSKYFGSWYLCFSIL